MNFYETVALISGGASGIGLAIVKELLKNGIKGISILDVNEELGSEVIKNINKEFNGKAIFIKTDVTNDTEYEDAFKQTIKVFGKIDLVLNNAGIGHETFKTIDVNLIGIVRGALLGIKFMSKYNGGNGGTIICTSSIHAFDHYNISPIYNAAKSGVVGFVRTYGQEYHFKKTGIRFLAICPGGTNTPILDNFRSYLKNDYWKDREVSKSNHQKPEVCGRAVIYMLNNAKNGSVWIVDKNILNEVEIPDYKEYTKVVVKNI